MEYLEGRRSLSIIGENDTDKKADINRFIALVRKYQHNTELTDAMLYEFIDKVVVHAPTGGMGRYRQQQIDVYFSFIGNYMPDGAVISEEERIAQIDAIYEEKKKVKNQRQKKRAKERRASLKERVKTDPDRRSFYEKECERSGWSVREMKRQIATSLFERLLLSDGKANKEKVYELATKGQELAVPEDIVKNPYVFEFLGIPENKPVLESDFEKALVRQIEDFFINKTEQMAIRWGTDSKVQYIITRSFKETGDLKLAYAAMISYNELTGK